MLNLCSLSSDSDQCIKSALTCHANVVASLYRPVGRHHSGLPLGWMPLLWNTRQGERIVGYWLNIKMVRVGYHSLIGYYNGNAWILRSDKTPS